MVGPWNGIHPRPTLVISSDVVPGLAWHPSWRRIVNHRVCFPLPKTITLTVVMFSLDLKLRITFGNSCNMIPCYVKYDGDCMSGLTFVWGNLIWSYVRLFIGTLPDRPRGYTVWSTLEPSGMDSRTWAGIIQVGSATREYILHSGQEYGHVVALQTYVLHIGCAYGRTVACGGPDPRVRMKDKRLLWNNHWMFQACELGLPLQG
jgi:hypothetical protein